MGKSYDVIVIGAGNGGLAAGAFTAKNGLKTLVVEKHNIPGGSATSFVRGRFEFETSLHELATVGPEENPGQVRKLMDELGADIDWYVHMDETFRMIVPDEDIDADMPGGVENFIMKLEEAVPGSAPFTKQAFGLGMEGLQARGYMNSPEFDPNMLGEKFPNFYKLAGHSIREVLDSIDMPVKAQNIYSCYWGYLGGTVEELDFMTYTTMLIAYCVFGAGMPKLRSHEISLALEKSIRDNGGDIWYNTEINKVLVKDGKAYGVVIDGNEYLAGQIVSNAYPDLVYGRMIVESEVPERAVKLVNSRELGLTFVTVYLGMNKSMEELGIESYSNFIMKKSDSVEQRKLATDTRDYPGYVVMNCLNKIIPDSTPEGTCQLFFTVSYFGNGWDDVKPEEYFDIKNKLAAEMIEHAEKALGISLMPYIEEIVIAAPPTFARYLNTPQGTPYGYQVNKLDTFVQRTVAKEKEKFIDNLHFVGAATHRGDGYSSAYLSGLDAGQDIVRAEKVKGGLER